MTIILPTLISRTYKYLGGNLKMLLASDPSHAVTRITFSCFSHNFRINNNKYGQKKIGIKKYPLELEQK